MANPSSPVGLQQMQTMQGIQWGDGAGHEYHLWFDGNQLWMDGQVVVAVLLAGNAKAGTNQTGSTLQISAGNGDGTGNGGALTVKSGNGGLTSGKGGLTTITAGDGAPGSDADGGRVQIATGGAAGVGVRPPVEIFALTDVPTVSQMTVGYIGFRRSGNDIIVYANVTGAIKSATIATVS